MKLRAKTILTLNSKTVLVGEEFETDDKVLIETLIRHGWAEVVSEQNTEKLTRRKKNEG